MHQVPLYILTSAACALSLYAELFWMTKSRKRAAKVLLATLALFAVPIAILYFIAHPHTFQFFQDWMTRQFDKLLG